jgi:hypothetical protein
LRDNNRNPVRNPERPQGWGGRELPTYATFMRRGARYGLGGPGTGLVPDPSSLLRNRDHAKIHVLSSRQER